VERFQAHSEASRLNGLRPPARAASLAAGILTPPASGPQGSVSSNDGLPATLCSIVIPTYNGRSLLERCLASIERHRPADPGITIEVLVSDDASTDGTLEWLSRAHPAVRVIRAERNGGFCTAANAGIAATRGQFIQLLNNDTEVTAGWIEFGLAPFADPSVGSVAPLVRVRSEPGRVDSAGDSYNLAGWPTKRGHGQPVSLFAGRPVEEVFGASGSSAFYHAEALKRLGGYDSLYGSYYEDVDLAFRLRWAGYRCVFASTCIIFHDVSATYDHRSADLQRRMSRNAELLFWTNLPVGLLAIAIVPHLSFLAAQALWRLAKGRLRPFLRGKFDATLRWREILARRRERGTLARKAQFRPNFALATSSQRDVHNHLRPPAEKSVAAIAAQGRPTIPGASNLTHRCPARKTDLR
jgi:O-antigen biosynthesis protein